MNVKDKRESILSPLKFFLGGSDKMKKVSSNESIKSESPTTIKQNHHHLVDSHTTSSEPNNNRRPSAPNLSTNNTSSTNSSSGYIDQPSTPDATAATGAAAHNDPQKLTPIPPENMLDEDPVFNMIDSYAAILCSAFMYCQIFDSLCYVGTHGTSVLAKKSRDLLVNLLRVVSGIFPENTCSGLLAVPSLIVFSTTTGNKSFPDRAHKASEILGSLVDIFSSNSFENIERSLEKNKEFLRGLGSKHSSSKIFKTNSTNSLVNSQLSLQPTFNNLSEKDRDLVKSNSNSSLLGSSYTTKRFQKNLGLARGIFEFAEDMKQFSILKSETSFGSDLFYDTRQDAGGLTSLSKNEYSKLIEQSKVIGKDGKEPFKWDWSCIEDLLEYGFKNNIERLNEAIKNKWIKRISGFYRCTSDEKAYFSNLDWEPGNLHFIETACCLYKLLAENEKETAYLNQSRRGMIFLQIMQEIERTIQSVMR